MKLPRWLIVSMLTVSAFAMLGAGAWWWVTWPDRTMREFCELLRASRWDEAAAMCDKDLANEVKAIESEIANDDELRTDLFHPKWHRSGVVRKDSLRLIATVAFAA